MSSRDSTPKGWELCRDHSVITGYIVWSQTYDADMYTISLHCQLAPLGVYKYYTISSNNVFVSHEGLEETLECPSNWVVG